MHRLCPLTLAIGMLGLPPALGLVACRKPESPAAVRRLALRVTPFMLRYGVAMGTETQQAAPAPDTKGRKAPSR